MTRASGQTHYLGDLVGMLHKDRAVIQNVNVMKKLTPCFY